MSAGWLAYGCCWVLKTPLMIPAFDFIGERATKTFQEQNLLHHWQNACHFITCMAASIPVCEE